MKTNSIRFLEITPKLLTRRCKIISFILKIFLQFTTFISALIAWYIYDYFIAIATLLLVFIIMGIVRSKIRNAVIPPNEYQYNDQAIADWYTAKELCLESEED